MKSRPIIAVVDDESLFQTWLVEVLDEAGFRTAVAGTGADGLALVQSGSASLMLLDLRLPDGNGIDFLRRYRALDGDLDVIMMTA